MTEEDLNEKYPLSNCGLPDSFGSFSGASATSTGKIQPQTPKQDSGVMIFKKYLSVN